MKKWYVGTMNDACFIIDQKPRPAPVDYINSNALPNVNVIAGPIDGDMAQKICDAHNAAR